MDGFHDRPGSQGAWRTAAGTVRWRVWAPRSAQVTLITRPAADWKETEMPPQGDGYFACELPDAPEGLRYLYRLADGGEYPDPASRWQPVGVHRPSAVFFPEEFSWTDRAWRGVAREDLVIYELHVGTFTPEGTLAAIVPRLAELRELGVTALELMPVAQFPGERNWGYDGVHLFAVQNSYGGPRGLQQLVDAAHAAGLAVILDVVYNHLGNEGNYLAQFGPYFTDRYHTPWSCAVNFDGPGSDAVRQFVIDNACQWVRDFHLDGLRLDAVQTIYDFGAQHILAELQEAVQREAALAERTVHVIAETDQNDTRLIRPVDRGGYGLSAVWSDDLHHSVHALLTGQRDGYYEDFGQPRHLAKAIASVHVYDGCYSVHRRRRHGSRVTGHDRTQFVVCVQNHDQVGNRALGDRFGTLLPLAAQRLAGALLLLSPCTPLLFMGQEYGETRPFPFFCSFGDPELIEAVRRGRRQEFADLSFRWGAEIADPQAPETFAAAQLSWSWPAGSPQAGLRTLYQDLLQARRVWPPLRDRRHTSARLAAGSGSRQTSGRLELYRVPLASSATTAARLVPVQADDSEERVLLVVERGSGDDNLLACANVAAVNLPLILDVGTRRLLLSTEDRRYGGQRTREVPVDFLAPYELVVFGREE